MLLLIRENALTLCAWTDPQGRCVNSISDLVASKVPNQSNAQPEKKITLDRLFMMHSTSLFRVILICCT